MNIRTTLLAAASLGLLHSGCEMHPASKTVPGYAEKMKKKQEEKQKQPAGTLSTDSAAPTYFPPQGN
jgi:hypothetical protein